MLKIALIGSPNSGKSTLFNWITGKKQKVVNYPGSTVDYTVGTSLDTYGDPLVVFDTPGTYSLEPQNPEEEVTSRLLLSDDQSFNCIVAVLDITQVYRQAPLVRQMKKLGRPVVIALTMQDLYQSENSKKTVDLAPLIEKFQVPVAPVDGLLGGGVRELLNLVHAQADREVQNQPVFQWSLEEQRAALEEAKQISRSFAAQNAVQEENLKIVKTTEWLDKILLSRFFGPIIFLVLMALLFSSIFWFSTPLMDLVDQGFSHIADMSRAIIPEGLFSDFVADGVVGSMAAVLVFVPQIFILFVGLSILEESGYLARAATLADRPLSWFGLSGKAFVPLLSGFACAVPAVMAARTVSDRKIRWLTVFVIPFMTCSARLPVYALLLSFLAQSSGAILPGLILAGLYFGGVLISFITAAIFSRVIKTAAPSFHLLELPYYRRPRLGKVIQTSYARSMAYVRRAGPVIFVFAVLLWLLSTFPQTELPSEERLQQSYMAQMGRTIEPIVEPLGVDWRVGVGLISAFAAREVFVSSLAVIFKITDVEDDEERLQASLLQKMKTATNSKGQPIFGVASVAALLVFFMIALQCISTVGVVYREMGSMKFAVVQVLFMNILAYILAVLTYNLLS